MADGGRRPDKAMVDRSEGFGERLLGVLLDRAHEMPPQLIAPLVAEEVARVGGRDVSILLQDYEQLLLVPLPGRRLHGRRARADRGLPRRQGVPAARRRSRCRRPTASGCTCRCWTAATRWG